LGLAQAPWGPHAWPWSPHGAQHCEAPPPPPLPKDVLARTAQRYREVLEILFPEEAAAWQAYL